MGSGGQQSVWARRCSELHQQKLAALGSNGQPHVPGTTATACLQYLLQLRHTHLGKIGGCICTRGGGMEGDVLCGWALGTETRMRMRNACHMLVNRSAHLTALAHALP